MKIKRSSFFIQLYELLGLKATGKNFNICTLMWGLLINIILITLMIALVVFLCVLFIDPIFSIIMYFFTGTFTAVISEASVFVGTMMYAIIILQQGGKALYNLFKKVTFRGKKDNVNNAKQPSLFKVWWKSFKEKTCVLIEVEDE